MFHWYWCESRTANGSRYRFSKGQKKTLRKIRIRWNGDDSGDIGAQQYLNDITGNVEINLEEARLAKYNIFTDIAVKHLG